MTKLNKSRIKWLVDQVVRHGRLAREVCTVYGVSERRVQQLVRGYRMTKKYPELQAVRRPKTLLSTQQKLAIEAAYRETQLTPRMLYHELRRRGIPVAKNKLYQFMRHQGWVQNEPRKQKKRKRSRYERDYTGELLHGDYHRTSERHPHAIIWLDDSSRKILAGGEFASPNAENAITTFKVAEAQLAAYDCPLVQVNTDRASVFVSNKRTGTSAFEQYCISKRIDLIPSRANNPQTNGKVERRWREYDKHRWRFNSIDDWIAWYNNRLTTALDIEHFETPNNAFIRRLPNLIALLFK